MEQAEASDHDIFNAIMIINEYKKNPVEEGESFEIVKRRVEDWTTQMKYARNLSDHEYDHLLSWKPSQQDRDRVEREKRWPRSKPRPPKEVRQAQALLERVKLQIETALSD